MMNIQEIREKYPQYNKISDKELADKLYSKYSKQYSQLPIDEFYSKIGFSPENQVAQSQQQPEQPPSLLDKIVNHPSTQFALGLGEGAWKLPVQLGNLVNRYVTHQPEVDIGQITPRAQGEAGEAGKFIGEMGAASPIGALKSAASRAAGYGLMGAAESPDNPITGALSGAAAGRGLEMAIPYAGKVLGKGFEGLTKAVGSIPGIGKLISPKLVTEDLYKSLSGGIHQSGKKASDLNYSRVRNSLEQDIKNSAEKHKSNYLELKNPVIEQAGQIEIFPKNKLKNFIDLMGSKKIPSENLSKIISRDSKIPENIKDQFSKISEVYNNKLTKSLIEEGKPFDSFLKNPTLENADNLQTALREFETSLRWDPSKEVRDFSSKVRELRQNILGRMETSLIENGRQDLADQYANSRAYYRENLVPYEHSASKAIRDLVKGKKAVLGKIHTVFARPEAGGTLQSQMKKIAQDIGSEGRGKILYSYLASGKPDPKYLVKRMNKLGEAGLSNYAFGEDYPDLKVNTDIRGIREALNRAISGKRIGLTGLAGLGISTALGKQIRDLRNILTGGE